jgi:hypothetical protein
MVVVLFAADPPVDVPVAAVGSVADPAVGEAVPALGTAGAALAVEAAAAEAAASSGRGANGSPYAAAGARVKLSLGVALGVGVTAPAAALRRGEAIGPLVESLPPAVNIGSTTSRNRAITASPATPPRSSLRRSGPASTPEAVVASPFEPNRPAMGSPRCSELQWK